MDPRWTGIDVGRMSYFGVVNQRFDPGNVAKIVNVGGRIRALGWDFWPRIRKGLPKAVLGQMPLP